MTNTSTHDLWTSAFEDHIDLAKKTRDSLHSALDEWLTASLSTIRSGGKIMFCGNGGSAADAQHIAAELSIKLYADRPAIAGICLSLDPSAMTACANDYGYDHIFARQIQALGRKGDMLVGLSTSGNSGNVLKAIEAAKQIGITTVGLTGETGGKMSGLCDHLLKVPHTYPGRIQEMHITIGHIYCRALETGLGLA